MIKLDFNQPFDLQVEFFRDKLNLPTEKFDDLWKDEHAKAFMIAGAVEAEMLADFRAAVDSAISNGDTLETFRGSFDTIVEKYGWSYNGSRNWRSNVIYETNIRTAYQAARWKQLTDPELTKIYPYLEYGQSSSRNPRESHQLWVGTILPATDPWWDAHYPPNDWGCDCKVFSVGPRDLAKAGKSGPDKAPTVPGDLTGVGEGWDYNVGTAAEKGYEQLSDQIDRMPKDIGAEFMSYLLGDAVFDAVAEMISAAIGGKG